MCEAWNTTFSILCKQNVLCQPVFVKTYLIDILAKPACYAVHAKLSAESMLCNIVVIHILNQIDSSPAQFKPPH